MTCQHPYVICLSMVDSIKLSLKSDNTCLNVDESEWKEKLSITTPDPIVGIYHAPLRGNEDYRLHVASIPEKVGCHFHRKGNEDYAVVSGSGTLHWGKVSESGGNYTVSWETPVNVESGDNFVIPEGYAHQLAKRGESNLIILFGCPDSHLDDNQDRTILPDASTLK